MAGVDDDKMIDRIYDALDEINQARRLLMVPVGWGERMRQAAASHFLLDVKESAFVPDGQVFVINPHAIKIDPHDWDFGRLTVEVEPTGAAKIINISEV